MFEVEKKKVKSFFAETRSFTIPDFQRGFAWGLEEVDEFYEDLKSESLFFIGSFILKAEPKEKEKIEIIDGQQRTVTLSLCCLALGSLFSKFAEREDGENTQDATIHAHELRKAIAEIDPARPSNISNFKIKFNDPETDNFFSQILSARETAWVAGIQATTELQKRVKKVYLRLVDLMEKDTNLAYQHLVNLKEKIEKTELILITIEKDEIAYQIFETVNARGVDLTVAELLKNHLFKTIPDHAQLKEKWQQITDLLKQTQAKQLDLSTSLRLYWISNFAHLTKRKLYRAIKEELKENGLKEEDLLDRLYAFSLNLSRIYDLDQGRWSAIFGKSPEDRRASVRWFYYKADAVRVFPKSTQYVMVFTALLNKLDLIDVSSAAFRKLLHAIESINFVYLEIANLPGNVLEKKYSEFSRKISQTKTRAAAIKCVSDLQDDLRKILLEKVTPEAVGRYVSSLRYPKDSEIVRFILLRLEYLKTDFGVLANPANTSLEHIFSQSSARKAGGENEDWAHSIGNLALMEFSGPQGNGSLNDKAFSEKRGAYEKSAYGSTRNLISREVWGEAHVAERSRTLAEVVWKVWGPDQDIKNFPLP